MSYLIGYLIIGIYHLIKWTVFKSRLWIAAIPVTVTFIFFYGWYEANTMLADIIGIVLIASVLASWIVTLIKKIKDNKLERAYLVKRAYEKYGEPIVLKKRNTNMSDMAKEN